mmetsp:Transcript_38000/g.74699  ORF Transcript_38000/g.74699 Transcript_38000/m.74699 type:complete len:84 (-) Transcript_38000:461-712(-)
MQCHATHSHAVLYTFLILSPSNQHPDSPPSFLYQTVCVLGLAVGRGSSAPSPAPVAALLPSLGLQRGHVRTEKSERNASLGDG